MGFNSGSAVHGMASEFGACGAVFWYTLKPNMGCLFFGDPAQQEKTRGGFENTGYLDPPTTHEEGISPRMFFGP